MFGMDPPVPSRCPMACGSGRRPTTPRWPTELYNQSRVFVQPSFHEGFGYTAVEAMACGCALVTTDNGGSRDYAVADETALVVPPGDPAGLADARRAAAPGRRRSRTGSRDAGAELVRGRFDWDNTAAVLEPHLEAYVADPERYQRAPADALVAQEGAG